MPLPSVRHCASTLKEVPGVIFVVLLLYLISISFSSPNNQVTKISDNPTDAFQVTPGKDPNKEPERHQNNKPNDDDASTNHVLQVPPKEKKKKKKTSRIQLLTDQTKLVNIDNIETFRKNAYIQDATYVHNLNPDYLNNMNRSLSQAGIYYMVAGLAREYQAKYVIDLGCGKAWKLAQFHPEFIPIGIDFKSNLDYAKQQFPNVQFIELDLDQDGMCKIDIPLDIVQESVMITGDVVEHIVDPFKCYIAMLQHFANNALAMVISTPDRRRQAVRKHGPPHNKHHVREWTIGEMDVLLHDNGMVPMHSGWDCPIYPQCKKGERSYTTMVFIVPNMQARKTALMSTKPVSIQAFIIVNPLFRKGVLQYNIDTLTKQEIHVVLICRNKTDTKDMAMNGNVDVVNLEDDESAEDVIKSEAETSDAEWFIIQDAHEILTNLNNTSPLDKNLPSPGTNIASIIKFVHNLPNNFNAIAVTSIFLHNKNISSIISKPHIKFTASSPNWEFSDIRHLYHKFDLGFYKPSENVKIWRKSANNDIKIDSEITDLKYSTIAKVTFPKMKIYPFRLLGLRVHPSSVNPVMPYLDKDVSKKYSLELGLSHVSPGRSPLYEPTWIY